MKRIFVMAALVLAAGCTSVEQAQDSLLPIRLSGVESTKTASPTDEGQQFMVNAGRCDGTSYSSASAEIVFDGTKVSRTSSGWSYSPIKYWTPSSIYHFRAVYPASVASVTDNLVDDVTVAGFEVKSAQASQSDLMLSDLVVRTTGSPVEASKVTLTFSHLLSKVNVKVLKGSSSEDAFSLTKVSMFGMNNIGTYSNGTWDVSAGSVLECGVNYASGSDVTTTGTMVWGTDGLLLIPETLGNVKLVLDYKVTHNGTTSAKSVTFTIPTTPQWQAGYEYTYTVTMNESYNITFSTPIVEPWGTDQATGTIIIK